MKIIKRMFCLLLIFIILSTSLLGISLFVGYKKYDNVIYGEKVNNIMDIYIPKFTNDHENSGCVLFIHGGSWSSGDKKEEDLRCRLVASNGYIAASMNYTLNNGSEEKYSVFNVLDEIDSALLKLKEFALEKEIDINKVAISGYSAGAHLSMLYSYSRFESSPIEIVFSASMAGPSDISSDVWGENMAKRIGKLLVGLDVDAENNDFFITDDLLLSISPVSYINENTPPSLIMHGGKDNIVPIKNAESLINKFNEYSVPYDYIYLKDSDHMLIQNPILHLKYLHTLIKYCKKYFV